MKKSILLTLMSISIFACSTSNNYVNVEKTVFEEGLNHAFNTQAVLTEAELVADLTSILKKNNSLILVNRIVYYKANYPALFATAMTNNPSLQSALKVNTGVMVKMKNDISFSNFVNNIKVSSVTTLAGDGTRSFTDNANPLLAQFANPVGIAVDTNGNVYVADTSNHRIRKITASGGVTTIAGDGTRGFADNANPLLAQFSDPCGIAVDSSGNVYVSDTGSHRIRKITAGGGVTTLAGDGTRSFADNANPLLAEFDNPFGIAVDSSGNVYVSDTGNNRIRKITAGGGVTTIAGDGTYSYADNANPLLAQFANPVGIAADSSRNVYVADTDNNRTRKISVGGGVTTIAGNGIRGFTDNANPLLAEFANPHGIAVDSSGNLYVADTFNNRIRKISVGGGVTTIAGNGIRGFTDNANSLLAQFTDTYEIEVDTSGNIYVADSSNHRIRKIQ